MLSSVWFTSTPANCALATDSASALDTVARWLSVAVDEFCSAAEDGAGLVSCAGWYWLCSKGALEDGSGVEDRGASDGLGFSEFSAGSRFCEGGCSSPKSGGRMKLEVIYTPVFFE